ncbi:glycosyltransferase [Jeotgalibaca arthritidis]|uniref:Glycosyltransferase family 1 protein n=1 Tax=Jeotgalibaca arthritidis TaxID=1868794 RepID=A0A6G7KB02_9LACT|nr:glycosyltransferase [Jeotgalibaca arthritidis]QII82448.1 glycosyltransferase family 1 protein [Jeotgalibaca arthritidis]
MLERKKILHIMSGYGGGISSHIRNLAQVVDPEKISFDVIGFTDYTDEFLEEIALLNGKALTFLKPKKVGFRKFYKHAIEMLKENGPYDVIQCHTSGHYALVFKMMALQLKVNRFIVHAHKTQYDNMDSFKDKIRVKLDQYISRYTADQLTSCSSESSNFVFGEDVVKKNKVMHIPNSIPLNKYMLQMTDKEIIQFKTVNDIPTDRLILGNIGRFNLQKNHYFMVKLIKYLAENNQEFMWLFVGAGELEDEIKKLIEESNLSEYVMFLGRREDANILYQIFDVFVLPSFYEGLPTVIVETQAAGIPAVIADTITKEVDLGLNLVSYLPLEASLGEWEDEILRVSKEELPTVEERKSALDEKAFNNVIAGKLYEDFIFKKISTFKIGESYTK